MTDDADPPLSLATIDQIAGELKRRFRGSLLAVTGEAMGEPDCDATEIQWRGPTVLALGLAAHATRRLGIAMDTDDQDDDE